MSKKKFPKKILPKPAAKTIAKASVPHSTPPPAFKSKFDFINAPENRSKPAKELIAEAKKRGMTLSDKYIYTARSLAKSRVPKTPGGLLAQAHFKAAANGRDKTKEALIAAAMEMGFGPAIQHLEETRAAMRARFAG